MLMGRVGTTPLRCSSPSPVGLMKREETEVQYMGGKSRIGKHLASLMAPKGPWWEPFSGAWSVTQHLAKYGRGLTSDVNPHLYVLAMAWRSGWRPQFVTPDVYREARVASGCSPLRTWCGYAVSFGGKWFGGFAKDQRGKYMQAYQVNSMAKKMEAIYHCDIGCIDFLSASPGSFETVYCDPPYFGAHGYRAVGGFDHPAFWRKCLALANAGSRVFVSEYMCPVAHEVVWEKSIQMALTSDKRRTATERLFRILPSSPS